MFNFAVPPFWINELVENEAQSFFLSTDGFNDTGIEKINPISVRKFNGEVSKITTKFLHTCPPTEGNAASLFCNIVVSFWAFLIHG